VLITLIKEFELSRKAFSSSFFSYGKQSLRPSVSTEGLSFRPPVPQRGNVDLSIQYLLGVILFEWQDRKVCPTPFVKTFILTRNAFIDPGINTYDHRMQN